MVKRIFPLVIILVTAFFLGCCSTNKKTEKVETQPQPAAVQEQPTETPAPAPAPVAKEEVPAPTYSGSCNPCPLVKLVPRVAERASIGKEYTGDVEVIGLDNASDVVIYGSLPQGVTYVKSEPPAEVSDGRLTWKYDMIRRGQTEKIQIWFKANKEGQHVCCYAVIARPVYCVATLVGKPALAITKEGPATALINQEVTYTIVVKNTGNAMASSVVVTDQVPEGLTHESGQKTLSFPVGDLAAGDSKTMSVTLKATQTGRFCNVATATSGDADEVKAEACTEVKSQSFELRVECTEKMYLRNRSTNKIVLENTGQTALANLKVVASCNPSLVTILEDTFNKGDGRATWDIAELGAGEKKEIPFKATSGEAGKNCIKVTVTTGEGLSKEAECCTNWEGIPAMLMEVVDDPDPVKIGDETLYTIDITNQGTKADTNITIQAVFPPETDPLSATGPDASIQGTVSGKEVNFTPVPVLEPKQKIRYTIKAKGVAEGDGRLKVYLRSAFLSERGKPPVTEEESTNVY